MPINEPPPRGYYPIVPLVDRESEETLKRIEKILEEIAGYVKPPKPAEVQVHFGPSESKDAGQSS